jgi:hypothetical protein
MIPSTDGYREIDSRSNAGISVTLLVHFEPDGEALYGRVDVESADDSFSLTLIPLDKAVDYYNHPFYYGHRHLMTKNAFARR